MAMRNKDTKGIRQETGDITLKDMGSFSFGGTVTRDANGDYLHGDHGYAQYFIPRDCYDYPIIMWHGMKQSGRCWETTPDGRDGFWQIFTRRGWPTYIIDQPRRGRAFYTDKTRGAGDPSFCPMEESECNAWAAFRLGTWTMGSPAEFFEGTAFPKTPLGVEQFMRLQTWDYGIEAQTMEYYWEMGDSVVELLKQAGASILMTHSNSGKYGWRTAMRAPELVKGIVAIEPGHAVLPLEIGTIRTESPVQDLVDAFLAPQQVPMTEFLELTKMPIRIIFGDYIKKEPSAVFGDEVWRVASEHCELMVRLLNENGGNAKVIYLPEIGITGNDHAMFSDVNNLDIADVISKELSEMGLDRKEHGCESPQVKELSEYTIDIKK